MTWPWQSPPPERRVVRCPDCGAEEPNFRMVELTNHYYQAGEIIEEITGYRVACQKCACVYSIWPHGTFRQNPTSLPVSPTPPPRSLFDPSRLEPGEPPRELLPVPKQRPTV